MSVQLAFWLFVVFGLALYAILARSAPDEVAERRRRYEVEQRRLRAEERVAASRPPAARLGPAPRAKAAPRARSASASSTRPAARRKSPPSPRRRKAALFAWPFKWPTVGRKRGR